VVAKLVRKGLLAFQFAHELVGEYLDACPSKQVRAAAQRKESRHPSSPRPPVRHWFDVETAKPLPCQRLNCEGSPFLT
jgi:hypothetical protein